MTPVQIIALKNALSLRRKFKYPGPIPTDPAEWLRQMDEVADEAGEPNVYRWTQEARKQST